MGIAKTKLTTVEDRMRANNQISLTPGLLTLIVLTNLCIACAGSNPLSPGGWVPEEDRIAVMDGGPHKGSWQTRDLTINYEYQEAAPDLQVKGIIDLANYIVMGYNALEYFDMYIHLLEANGIVLETKRIRGFGFRRPLDLIGEMTFSGSFDLTQDTVAFAFSYSGRAVSTGGAGLSNSNSSNEGRIDWDFWKIPRRRPPEVSN